MRDDEVKQAAETDATLSLTCLINTQWNTKNTRKRKLENYVGFWLQTSETKTRQLKTVLIRPIFGR